jgi:hypothetical protein
MQPWRRRRGRVFASSTTPIHPPKTYLPNTLTAQPPTRTPPGSYDHHDVLADGDIYTCGHDTWRFYMDCDKEAECTFDDDSDFYLKTHQTYLADQKLNLDVPAYNTTKLLADRYVESKKYGCAPRG